MSENIIALEIGVYDELVWVLITDPKTGDWLSIQGSETLSKDQLKFIERVAPEGYQRRYKQIPAGSVNE